ncbi:MAG: hypothetical protein JRN26_06910 [Nitrososphaerota archaeon]|jgi:hypothetical protein|nr:hypothetical protein [Nitrososphaerota archaeon]MDG6927422.1 hypothetical protein [Nitrososphaerota archaeon]MDG6931226.1 hypothetical protein [Nitrososphaerota archaeon]MDG6931889.1 hypothetical protein [Nitrososphaerota archaeon]MDG6936591.1 hypothetical protein [Nitrososphaerota archaeon]
MEGRKNTVAKLISDALAEYGEINKNVVLWHLEHTYNLKPENVQSNPELFIRALHTIFGDFESIVEDAICEKIAGEYGLNYHNQGFVALLKELNLE